MTVEPLAASSAFPGSLSAGPARVSEPDEALGAGPINAAPENRPAGSFSEALGSAFADADAALGRADRSEQSFAAGRGGLQEMVLERAQADVALSLAGAAASRVSQALTTILGMQV